MQQRGPPLRRQCVWAVASRFERQKNKGRSLGGSLAVWRAAWLVVLLGVVCEHAGVVGWLVCCWLVARARERETRWDEDTKHKRPSSESMGRSGVKNREEGTRHLIVFQALQWEHTLIGR